ncbi:MAG: hypothetical protein ACE5I4_03365 [Thermoplasmata archaeon]
MTLLIRLPPVGWREVGIFAFFIAAFAVLFVGVPPVPLCDVGACVLNPRPEAFLLAAALPFGIAAILGVSVGVLSGALLYEAIHPTGITYVDAGVAAAAFLAACLSGRWVFRRVPSWPGAVGATMVITGLVTVLLGSYAFGARGIDLPGAYTSVLAEALIPINVAGGLFLAWFPGWRRRRQARTDPGTPNA